MDTRSRDELIPVEEAAARLGMEPKRLRGFILRNKLGDPIGDMERVYEWSLPADTSDDLIPGPGAKSPAIGESQRDAAQPGPGAFIGAASEAGAVQGRGAFTGHERTG